MGHTNDTHIPFSSAFIYALGCDILDMTRFQKLDGDNLDRLAGKILSDAEWDGYVSAKDKIRFLAVRFSVKESISKALKTGVRGFTLRDITLIHDELGAPYAVCSEGLIRIMADKGVAGFEISVSHDGNFVFTTAIALKG